MLPTRILFITNFFLPKFIDILPCPFRRIPHSRFKLQASTTKSAHFLLTPPTEQNLFPNCKQVSFHIQALITGQNNYFIFTIYTRIQVKSQRKQLEGETRRKQGYSPWSSNCFLFSVQLPQLSWVVSWRCQERLASPAPHCMMSHPYTIKKNWSHL